MSDPTLLEVKEADEPKAEEIPQAFPFPHPMTVLTGTAMDGSGRAWVLMRVQHAAGEFVGFLSSEFAAQVAGMLTEAANQVPQSSGLIVPQTPLTRGVPVSLPKPGQQGPPLNRAARRRQKRG